MNTAKRRRERGVGAWMTAVLADWQGPSNGLRMASRGLERGKIGGTWVLTSSRVTR